MTFLEAAIAILQREGRPLHFKKLTEIALQENLLTVVGRTPEVTMQQRLNDALKKEDPRLLLTREKPGVFGLRYYAKTNEAARVGAIEPAGPMPSQAKSAPSEAAEPEGRKRRRRGGRGRGRRDEGQLPAGARPLEAGDMRDEEEGLEAPPHAPRTPPAPHLPLESLPLGDERTEATVPERRSFAEAAAVVAAAHRRRTVHPDETPIATGGAAPTAAWSLPSAAETSPPSLDGNVAHAQHMPDATPAAAERADEGTPHAPEPGDEDEFEHPSGPLIAPSFGTEELVRGEEHREPFEQRVRPGRGRERFRDRKGGRPGPRDGEGRRGEPAPSSVTHEPAPPSQAAPPARPAPDRSEPRYEPRSGVELPPVDAAIEILRGAEGRPVHVRQIVEMALKRRLLRGDLNDLMRLVRGAIVVDSREREAAGLRPRVRASGGNSYQLADRRLETELARIEREIGDAANQLREATRAALLRRMTKLPSHAFETLMRLLASRLGLVNVELVKRGDGVAYFGGERQPSGAAGVRRRVLIGIRPTEAEVSRRAVGELRAGLKARGFDEGLLLAGGRVTAEALADLGAAGGGVTVYDAEELASLCLRHGVGTMRRAVLVDALDVDLMADLAEA